MWYCFESLVWRICTAVKHLANQYESWVPRSADKTFLNHSTVRGYKYWPADHYTQETSEAVTVDVVQMNVTFVWSHFVFFSLFYIVIRMSFEVSCSLAFVGWAGAKQTMKSSHRIVHSDWNCEDESACLSLLSESAFLNPAVVLPFFHGICWKICSFLGTCVHEYRTRSHACGTSCMWYCFESWVWRICTAVKHLANQYESWVPRSTDKTFLNHSTVRGYKYWPADHYTQETSEAATNDVVQMNVTFVWSHFVFFSLFYIVIRSLL